jgi:serine protease Do
MASHVCGVLLVFLSCLLPGLATAELSETIPRIKPSILVNRHLQEDRQPAVRYARHRASSSGDGNLVATNAHVVADIPDPEMELVVRIGQGRSQRRIAAPPGEGDGSEARRTTSPCCVSMAPLCPRSKLANSDSVREGQAIAFTGFPIGGALGFSPVTHRGMVSSITPIALPAGNANGRSTTN